jgi:predicted GH43/DUF377 family glycosyl hydrolase
LQIERLPLQFQSNIRRVITRHFDPGGEIRIQHIVDRVLALDEEEVEEALAQVLKSFGNRHENIEAVLEEHYWTTVSALGKPLDASRNRRLLIGSYFTMEYSIESAALFNPSIVKHRDQEHLEEGAVRFIMSFRATGEGHISSIVFRSGVITADHAVHVAPPGRYTRRVRCSPDKQYDKALFCRKLREMTADATGVALVMDLLADHFTMRQLEHAVAAAYQAEPEKLRSEEIRQNILSLARANYQLEVSPGAEPSEVVIFPLSSNESRGIEDLRLVRFVEDDGSATYYGTYTAYNGYHTLPQILDTSDFLHIGIHTLNGAQARNKGMALFPRRIHGHYVMCSRIDGENLYLMYSDIVQFWESAELLQTPRLPWEFVQIGNCGSPLETPHGWLLLTHGVGPMRTYCMGAMLLDLDDPSKVIGHLQEPLIVAAEEERDGYVPNVVYSCGAMLHNGTLYVPFSTSDHVTRFGFVPLDALLQRLK